MPFQKGNNGNPQRQKRAKQFYNMLNVALKDEKENPQALRKIADKLVQEAIKGESWAVKEIADRLDGRPAQEVDAVVEQTQKWIGPPPKTAEEWQADYGDNDD